MREQTALLQAAQSSQAAPPVYRGLSNGAGPSRAGAPEEDVAEAARRLTRCIREGMAREKVDRASETQRKIANPSRICL